MDEYKPTLAPPTGWRWERVDGDTGGRFDWMLVNLANEKLTCNLDSKGNASANAGSEADVARNVLLAEHAEWKKRKSP